MKHFSLRNLSIVVLIIFFGCKETITENLATGDMVGFVVLYDTLAQPMFDKSGVKVMLNGTSLFALSDSSGKWRITNIPAGSYTLLFQKVNFATKKYFNIQLTGGGTYYYGYENGISNFTTTPLFAIPDLSPINLQLRTFIDTLFVTGETTTFVDSIGQAHQITTYDTIPDQMALFSASSEMWYHTNTIYKSIYFSKSDHINPEDPNSFVFYYHYPQYSHLGIGDFTIYRSLLLKQGFFPGDRVYCCAYAEAYTSAFQYTWLYWIDPETQKIIYTGFGDNHSEVKSFILP